MHTPYITNVFLLKKIIVIFLLPYIILQADEKNTLKLAGNLNIGDNNREMSVKPKYRYPLKISMCRIKQCSYQVIFYNATIY